MKSVNLQKVSHKTCALEVAIENEIQSLLFAIDQVGDTSKNPKSFFKVSGDTPVTRQISVKSNLTDENFAIVNSKQ